MFEQATGGALPAGVLAGHFESYGFQALESKAASSVALAVHAGWLVFPALAWLAFRQAPRWTWVGIGTAMLAGALWVDPHPLFWLSFGTGLLLLVWCLTALRRWKDHDCLFLVSWVLIFFAAAVVLFFAGSARYLLPMAAPVALLAAGQLRDRRRWLAVGLAAQLAVGLGLSVTNYQHWAGYRGFVAGLQTEIASRRTWVNGEWGLRFYAESAGALPLETGQPVRPGEMVLTSRIAYPTTLTTGGGVLTPVAEADVTSISPLRIIGLGARSAYSTVTLGYRPFDVLRQPIDAIRAEVVVEREPELTWLPMGAKEADNQIVSGIYQLEGDRWRWMSGRAVLLLKAPDEPRPIRVELYIPGQAPARQVTASVDGREVAVGRYQGEGAYTLESPQLVTATDNTLTVEIRVDQTFSPPGDPRELGVILSGAGFR